MRLFRALVLFVLALLIGNTAAGFAGGLAGGLAFAAAALPGALAKIPGVQGFNMFHGIFPPSHRFRSVFYHTFPPRVNQRLFVFLPFSDCGKKEGRVQ